MRERVVLRPFGRSVREILLTAKMVPARYILASITMVPSADQNKDSTMSKPLIREMLNVLHFMITPSLSDRLSFKKQNVY